MYHTHPWQFISYASQEVCVVLCCVVCGGCCSSCHVLCCVVHVLCVFLRVSNGLAGEADTIIVMSTSYSTKYVYERPVFVGHNAKELTMILLWLCARSGFIGEVRLFDMMAAEGIHSQFVFCHVSLALLAFLLRSSRRVGVPAYVGLGAVYYAPMNASRVEVSSK